MNSILVAFVLIVLIVIISMALINVNNRLRNKEKAQLLGVFNRLGADNNLTFSSQEALSNQVFGLDGINRKLLILKVNSGNHESEVIDLNEVRSCTLREVYAAASAPNSVGGKTDRILDKLIIAFEFQRGSRTAEIVVYDYHTNHVFEIPELTQKAKCWEIILTKLLHAPLQETA